MSLQRAEAGPSTVCLCSHTRKDKLALGELCSREAAYFKPPGNEIVPRRQTRRYHRSR